MVSASGWQLESPSRVASSPLFITPVAYLLIARFAKPHAHEEARLHEEMTHATRPKPVSEEQLEAAE